MLWKRILAACAEAEKDHPSLAAFRAGAREDQGIKKLAAWTYQSNVELDDGRETTGKRKDSAKPYYYVRLSVRPVFGKGLDGVPAAERASVVKTVLSDDADFVKAIGATLDREITRKLKEAASPAMQPERHLCQLDVDGVPVRWRAYVDVTSALYKVGAENRKAVVFHRVRTNV